MPTKKKELATENEMPVEEVVEEEQKAATCGHINKQAFNTDGLLEDLACTLPAGHEGDHSAKTQTLQKNPYLTKNPRAEYKWADGVEYEVREVTAFWSDAAGVPAEKIKPDYEGAATREEWVQKRRAKAQAANA